MLKQDHILKALQKAAEVMARAVGLHREGQSEEALGELTEAYRALLKVDAHTFEQVDSKTLARILGPADVTRRIARLLALEASLLESLGRAEGVKQKRTRAVELYLQVGVGEELEDLTTLRELHQWLKQAR